MGAGLAPKLVFLGGPFLVPRGRRRSSSSSAQAGRARRSVALANVTAAAAAEFVTVAALFPVDTVKVRRQLRLPARVFCLPSLYSGLGAALAGAVPSAMTFMLVHHSLGSYLRSRFELPPTLVTVVSSIAATTASTVLVHPLTVLRLQRQAAASTSSAARPPTRLSSPYAGLVASLMKDLPFDSLEFAVERLLRRAECRTRKVNHLPPHRLLGLGVTAGAIVGAVTAPLDVLRARHIASPTTAALSALPTPSALLCGLWPRIAHEAAASGLFFMVYHHTRQRLQEDAFRGTTDAELVDWDD